MNKKSPVGLALAIVLTFCLQIGLQSQAGHGKGFLSGVVVDQNGKPLENVVVDLEFAGGGNKMQSTTNKKGEWSFIALGTGRYNISVKAEGYLPVLKQVEVLQLSRNAPLTLELKEDPSKALRMKDEADQAMLEQGNTLFNDKKYDEAIGIFNQFAQKNPHIYHIFFNIGDCYREMQNHDEAIKQYGIGIDKAKQNADTVMQAKGYSLIGEVFLRQKDLKGAQGYFKQSLDLNPKDEILAYNVAEVYFNNQKVEDAITYYALAAQIKPDWGTPYLKLGYAYLNKAEYPKALENFNKFLEVDPNSDQAATVRSIIDYLKTLK